MSTDDGTGDAPATSSQGTADSGSGSGTDNYMRPIIDALLAKGIPQEQIDQLLAGAPQGDATEGLATNCPDAELIAGDPESPSPETDIGLDDPDSPSPQTDIASGDSHTPSPGTGIT